MQRIEEKIVISSSHTMPSGGSEPGTSLELLSLTRLSGSLEKLLLDAEYDCSDAEIVVEGTSVGVNRCILASRSPFFHNLFKKSNASSENGGKPKYLMPELVPNGKIGYETFLVFLNYVYTGKLKPSPPDVSTCVDESCAHDACGPVINFAVELMYACATFQMKEIVMVVQRRLFNFVDKAFVDDIIPIITVAFHCQLTQLLSHCVQRVALSGLDNVTLEKELPHELLSEVKSFRDHSRQELRQDIPEADYLYDKRVRKIHKALDSDDVELLKLVLDESDITLDNAHALHYAVAYCSREVVREVLMLGNTDLNLRNSRGNTVLHVAARRKDPTMIVGLLGNGACVSDTTIDGQTAITICRRLTQPKDYNESTTQGQETNTDRLCIDVLEREMLRNALAGNISVSSMMGADDLLLRLLCLENRVAIARVLFPPEANLAMQIAHADSTSEFRGLQTSKSSCGNLGVFDLNEIPSEQEKRLHMRLQGLQKTVETGRRFFPHCSEVVDRFVQDEMQGTLLLDGPPEEQSVKKMRYMELRDEVMKAFDKDKAEHNWASFSSSSSCSSSPKIATGRLFFPRCSEVLDGLMEGDTQDTLTSKNRDREEERNKRMRMMQLQEERFEAFGRDKAENSGADASFSSPSETDSRLLERARKLLQGNTEKGRYVQQRRHEKAMMTFDIDKAGTNWTSFSTSSSCSISPSCGV